MDFGATVAPTTKKKRSRSASHVKDKMPATLIKVAKMLFAKFGYGGTSVKMIADKAKANISLISYHFGGKEGLYRACIGSFGREGLETARRVLKPPTSLDEYRVRLGIFVEELLLCYVNDSEVVTIILRRTELDDDTTFLLFKETFFECFLTLHKFFIAAKKLKILNETSDTLILAQVLLGSVIEFQRSNFHNGKLYGQDLSQDLYRNQIARELLNLFTVGAVCRKEKK